MQKSSTKFSQTEFNNTLKSSHTMIKLGFFQGFKDSEYTHINVIHHINKLKDTGCLGLGHWDDPEGWKGEGGGRRVQDGEHM